MSEKKYPYQNTAEKDIKGEVWKEIPGFEDEYLLSNYGRLKSQDRRINYGAFDVFRRGRIIKQRLTHHDKKTGKAEIQMKLHKDGKRYYASTARYVYYLFVASFNLQDYSLVVSRRDGDTLNCRHTNLLLRSISDIAKEGFATEKRSSLFQLQTKPVTQYDAYGKMLASFNCAKDAAKATNLPQNYISDAARVKTRMAGGFFWRYGNQKQIRIPKRKKPVEAIPLKKAGSAQAYRNRDIENLPGEKWRPVPGYEDMYEVSDHGRVKCLRHLRTFITAKGVKSTTWKDEMIMKQIVTTSHNHYIDESNYHLLVTLNKDGIPKTFSISRLVYASFGKQKGQLARKIVAHKDGNNTNNHIANLNIVSQSEVLKAAHANKRKGSYFATMSPKERQKYARQTAAANSKAVDQFDANGKYIASFDSFVSAEKATGATSNGISNVIRGRYKTAGGFIWRLSPQLRGRALS